VQLLEQQQRMDEHIAFRMVIRRLRDALHPRDLGQHMREQPALIEELEAAAGVAFGQDAHDFVADALPGNAGDFCRERAHRRPGRGLDLVLQARGEAYRPQHA
jgi:hypothetical protein